MNINKLLKIYLILLLIIVIVIVTFYLLGNKERIGYFNVSENINKTLEINNLSYIRNHITNDNDLVSFVNTNSSINKYVYSFKIHYYDRFFKNSDIYEVYINTNDAINNNKFITMFEIGEKGSPFGILISDKLINVDKIDNIKYNLKIKIKFIVYSLILSVILTIFIYYLLKLNLNKYKQLIFIFFISIIIFIIKGYMNPVYFKYSVVGISNEQIENGYLNSIQWDTGYGINDIQKYEFTNNNVNTHIYSNINNIDDIYIAINNEDNKNIENYKNFDFYIIENNTNSNVNIYYKDNLLISSTNSIVIMSHDNNILKVYGSSAIFNINTKELDPFAVLKNKMKYIKSFQLNTFDDNAYSLFFYANMEYSEKPYILEGEGINNILFNDFKNNFNKNFLSKYFHSSRYIVLYIASIIFSILISYILKFVFIKKFRNEILNNKYILIYITYFILYSLIFLFVGSYSTPFVSPVFICNFNGYGFLGACNTYYLQLLFTYLIGNKGLILFSVIPYSIISIVIFYLLNQMSINKYISFSIIPIVFCFIPHINYSLYHSIYTPYSSGLYLTATLLNLFLFVIKKNKVFCIFSLILAIITIMIRNDKIFIFFITVFTILTTNDFKFIKLKKFYIIFFIFIFSSILTLFAFKIVSPAEDPSRYRAIYVQYLYSYLLPPFYNENSFTQEEKQKLLLYEPYIDAHSHYLKVQNTNFTRLEAIQSNYTWSDVHPVGSQSLGVSDHDLKEILLSKIKEKPFIIIYSRIRAFIEFCLRIDFPYSYIDFKDTEDITFLNYNLYSKFVINYLINFKKSIYNIASYIDYKMRIPIERLSFPVNLLILIFIFINYKKAPITAYLNISVIVYYILMFLLSFARDYYLFGEHLFSLVSIILYIYESRYVKDKFDVSMLKKFIKR